MALRCDLFRSRAHRVGAVRAGAPAPPVLRRAAARSRSPARAPDGARREGRDTCARRVRVASRRSHEQSQCRTRWHRQHASHPGVRHACSRRTPTQEIETVFAHELAHHVYGDIWSALALEVVLVTLGCYLADYVLTTFALSAGLGWEVRCRRVPADCSRRRRCVGGAHADDQRALAGARAASRSLRARDDKELIGVHQRDEAARGNQPRRGTAIAVRRAVLPHASLHRRTDRSRESLGGRRSEHWVAEELLRPRTISSPCICAWRASLVRLE